MFDNDRLVCLLENIVKAVDLINSQTSWVKKDDFLLSPEGIFCLSGACMQLIFIGENAKTMTIRLITNILMLIVIFHGMTSWD